MQSKNIHSFLKNEESVMEANVTTLHIIKSRHDHRWTDEELKRLISMWLTDCAKPSLAAIYKSWGDARR